jgi:hypothetical protein
LDCEEIDVNRPNAAGETPLGLAIALRDHSTREYLLVKKKELDRGCMMSVMRGVRNYGR